MVPLIKLLSLPTFNKLEQSHTIRPELIRSYIIKTYNNPYDEDPDPHQILSFMEQDQYEDEVMDGMWMPVKFAAPLTSEDISNGIHYIENYEPITKVMKDMPAVDYDEPDEVSDAEIAIKMEESKWLLTKEQIPTEHIEQLFRNGAPNTTRLLTVSK